MAVTARNPCIILVSGLQMLLGKLYNRNLWHLWRLRRCDQVGNGFSNTKWTRRMSAPWLSHKKRRRKVDSNRSFLFVWTFFNKPL